MATYVNDTFTDADSTLLTAHSPDTGAAWSTGTSSPIITGNKIHGPLFNPSTASNAATPGSADYSVSADVIVVASPTYDLAGVWGRFDGANPYIGQWDNYSQEWSLRYTLYTSLGTYSDPSFVSGAKRVELRMEGTSIQLLVDGVSRISVTDSSLTGAGVSGLNVGGATDTALLMDNFTVADLSGTPPGTHICTGVGDATIDSPSWLSVAITGRPTTSGNGDANPPNWYNIGKLSWGSDNGAITARFLSRDLELIELPAGMTHLWWTLPAGETATVTELSAP